MVLGIDLFVHAFPIRCSSRHFICRTSLLPFAVVSGMATLEEALPPIEGDYVESPTKKAKLADHQLQTLNLGIVRITVSLDETDEEEHDLDVDAELISILSTDCVGKFRGKLSQVQREVRNSPDILMKVMLDLF